MYVVTETQISVITLSRFDNNALKRALEVIFKNTFLFVVIIDPILQYVKEPYRIILTE